MVMKITGAPERRLFWRELQQALHDSVIDLPKSQQDVLELLIHQELPGEVVADRLKISRTTVYRRLGKALSGIRRGMRKRGWFKNDVLWTLSELSSGNSVS